MSGGPLPDALLPLTGPASRVYAMFVERRNRGYDAGRGVQHLDRPVISVGNITTGGAGKTPMTAWIAARLLERGVRPLIAMRGYGAAPGAPSDEQLEYAGLLPDVPVIADPRRAEAVRAWLERGGRADCVLLDDGFQHRRLHRDLDLVLIGAASSALDDRLLPAGHLREPLESLRRADEIVITGADAVDAALAGAIERIAGRPPLAWCRHAWSHLEVHEGGAVREERPEWLAGRRVATLLGVARPGLVREQIERAGAVIVADVPARDHQRYDRATLGTLRPLCEDLDALVVTGKDWVKLRELIGSRGWPAPIVVPRVSLEFVEGEAALVARVVGVGKRQEAIGNGQ